MRNPDRQPTSARSYALRIAGTLLFALLLLWLNYTGKLPLADVFATLSKANIALVALSLALYAPFMMVKAARWRLLSADMLMPTRWYDAWRIYAISLGAGTFTPGQAGDALKAWYMQRMGFSLARALGAAVLDRLFDVVGLAVLGLVGVVVIGQHTMSQAPIFVGLTALAVVAVAFVAWGRTRTLALNLVMSRVRRIIAARTQKSRVASHVAEAAAWSLHPATIGYAGLLTMASFATSIFRVWLFAAALNIWLGPLQVAGFVGFTTAASLVPVTVGGVGTRDVVAAVALSQLGYTSAQGVAISALILLLNIGQAVIGWLVWLRYTNAELRVTNYEL